MTFSPLKVSDFLESVPIGRSSDSLKQLCGYLQSSPCHRLVITTKYNYPIGLLFSSELLAYLLQNKALSAKSSLLDDESLPICDFPHLIHPIVPLSADISLLTLLDNLLSEPLPIYAVIDENQEFLGLLDIQGALKVLFSLFSPNNNSFNHFSALFDSFPLPLLLTTVDGERVHQNKVWQEKLGDFQPKNLDCVDFTSSFTRLTPAHHTYLAAQLSSWQHQEEITSCCENDQGFTHQDPDNWQFFAYPYQDNPETPPLTLVVALDMGATYQHYRALEAKNADLLQLNRLKDDFLSGISHELKSPITAVVGLSSLLTDQRVGSLNTAQERYAQLIYGSGRQLMALVNDLLDLTRLETGQLCLTPTLISIPDICDRAYQILQNHYGAENLPQFKLEIEQVETVRADEQRLSQMLGYLLDNAVKLTPKEGNIGLRVKASQNWVRFTVWDTGEGIPEEAQSSLFQGFQTYNPYMNPNYSGTGLGLLLTQRLARAHGGDLSFVSNVGQGSRFILLLPNQTTLQEELGKTEDKNQKLVLIVETFSHFIEDLSDKLLDLGYQSVISRTGTEALEKARQLQPTLIFLNPWLPLLSGWDVLTLLKSDPKTQKIRVILTDSQTDSSLKSYQADAVLSQPIDVDILKNLLPEANGENNPNSPEKLVLSPLTLLVLYPNSEFLLLETMDTAEDLTLVHQLAKYPHRILQADDLEQAALLATIWQVDVLVLKGDRLQKPNLYWQELEKFPELLDIPLVTLDRTTTDILIDFDGLKVFPCIESLSPFWQVVSVAAQN